MVYLQRWHGWCHTKLLLSWCILCAPYNHAPCHFMQSHIRKVHVCLAATYHLHFWQNDQDLLHATAVPQGGMDTERTHIQCPLTQTERIYHHAYNNTFGIPLLLAAEENPARIPMNHLLQSPELDLPSGSMYLHGVRAV